MCKKPFDNVRGYRKHLDQSVPCTTNFHHIIPTQYEKDNNINNKKQKIKYNQNNNLSIKYNSSYEEVDTNENFVPTWEVGKLDHHLQPFQEINSDNNELYIIDDVVTTAIAQMNLCNMESLEEDNLPSLGDLVETLGEEENTHFVFPNKMDTQESNKIYAEGWSRMEKDILPYSTNIFMDSSEGMMTSLELFSLELYTLLFRADAPNYVYNKLMSLIGKHFVAHGSVIPTTFTTRANVVKHFSKKYNMQNLRPRIEYFSFKKKIFPLVTYDCENMIMSLLQDKIRLFNDQSLIFPTVDGTPFGMINTEPNDLGDLNTAKVLIEGCIRVTEDPSKDLPIGIIFYLDKITLDKHGHISMEPLQFTLSIFGRHVRNTPYAWRTCGFIPNIGLHSKAESKHLFKAEEKAYLTHLLLEQILTDYKNLEDSGIENYQFTFRGEQYIANLKFFVLVVLGDTEAHDKLCGHYNCRMLSVKCICRHCPVPSDSLDDPMSNYPLTLQSNIDTLVENGDMSGLKNMSQYSFHTVWKKLGITFGGNPRGIHGVTPSEPLHMIDLGIFKYLVQVFFAVIGSKDCKLHSLVDTWAKRVGKHLQHQSDRNLPRTYFPNGISGATKLNGHEYVGVILVLALLLRMDGPRKTILKYQETMTVKILDQWANLFELCVCWRKWLQSENIPKEEAIRSKKAHIKLVEMVIKYAGRQEGNEWKIIKLHMMLHIHTNLIDFAVPLNIDTSVPESNHKYNVKKPTSHTQKRASVLEIQAATRYYENLVMEHASLIALTEFSIGETNIHNNTKPSPTINNKMHGSKFEIRNKKIGFENNYELLFTWNTDIIKDTHSSKYIYWLAKHLFPIMDPNFVIRGCTEYHRKNLIFRAHPSYNNNGGWFDWAMFQWEDGNKKHINVPAQIIMFIMLPAFEKPVILDGRMSIKHGGLYALVESCYFPMEPLSSSNRIFEKKDKTVVVINRRGRELKEISDKCLYLVHVDTINDSMAAVPNLGNTNLEFVVLRPSSDWAKAFSLYIDECNK